MNNFKILALEGMPGVGKTTQAAMLKKYLESNYKNNNFEIFRLNPEDADKIMAVNEEISKYLEIDENIAILDGTVAATVILSDVKNNHYGSSIYRMDTEVKSYLNLLHKYRTINCLIVSDSMNYLEKRTGFNHMYLETFLKGFHYFEQSQIASNLNYIRIDITEQDRILAVQEKLKKTLNL
jgi:tRNA uridine 5-carbamoylmethylation protein Kti12